MLLEVTTVAEFLLTNVTLQPSTFIVWLQQMCLELVGMCKTLWTVYSVTLWPSWRTRITGTPLRHDRHGGHASEVLRDALAVMADTHQRYTVTPWPSWRTRTRGTPWRPGRHSGLFLFSALMRLRMMYTELLSQSWICHLWLSYCVARTDFLVFLPLIHKLNVRTVGYMKRSQMGCSSVFTPKHSRLFVSEWDW